MTKLTSILASSRLVALILSGLLTTNPSMAEPVNVQLTTSIFNTQHLKLSYPSPVRLQQVLADTIANLKQLPLPVKQTGKNGNIAQIYWPAAAILTTRNNPQQQVVLDKLSNLSATLQDEEREAVLYLQALLMGEQIGQRVFHSLDYDQVRIDLKYNPLISDNVMIILPPRPDSVWVIGAVEKPKELKWHERGDIQSYLKQAISISSSNNSYAWLIQPDGKVEKQPIAYWNKKHMGIAPGAIIYLGFTSLPDGLDTLNEELINLLRNRTL